MTSALEDAANRAGALGLAREIARTAVGASQARLAESERLAHEALTAADFDAAERHRADAQQAKAELDSQTVALEQVERAELVVAAEVQRERMTERREQLTDSIAATAGELADLLQTAREHVSAAQTALQRAVQVEVPFIAMQRQLDETRVGLGEIEMSVHRRFTHPVRDTFERHQLLASVATADLATLL